MSVSGFRLTLNIGKDGPMSQPEVKIFSLSTCSHCRATKKFLGECTIKYEFINVDQLQGDERKAIIEDVKKFNPRCSFPTIIIGDKVIVGFKEKEIKEALGM
jgi:glutaredoxin